MAAGAGEGDEDAVERRLEIARVPDDRLGAGLAQRVDAMKAPGDPERVDAGGTAHRHVEGRNRRR